MDASDELGLSVTSAAILTKSVSQAGRDLLHLCVLVLCHNDVALILCSHTLDIDRNAARHSSSSVYWHSNLVSSSDYFVVDRQHISGPQSYSSCWCLH